MTGFFAYGAHISIEDTYCDETVAARLISPPSMPLLASTLSGRLPGFSMYFILAPLDVSASTSGPMGRVFIRSLPVNMELLS